MLHAHRNVTLAARRGFLRLSGKKKTSEEQTVNTPSAHPISALLPTPTAPSKGGQRRTWAEDESRPSMSRLSRRMRMKLTKYAIALCLCAALLCALAVPVLSSIKVRHIRVEGAQHYEQERIALLTEVNIGDELLKCNLKQIEAHLMEQCSYLLSARVRRDGAGLHIVLTESTPRWALVLSEGRVALVDTDGYVCEVVGPEQISEGLCMLYMPLPMLPSEENEQVMQAQNIKAGQYIVGTSEALSLLERISSALDTVTLPAAPALLDLNDVYSVILTLEDGTQLLLHTCSDAERQLRRAVTAIESYTSMHPGVTATQDLIVDVDESFRVSIRAVPKILQGMQEKTEE
jgi:hypothetical protein